MGLAKLDIGTRFAYIGNLMETKSSMDPYQSEADARIEIDELLRQAGWDPADKSMVGTEVHVEEAAGVRESNASYGDSPAETDAAEKNGGGAAGSTRGRADYVLYNGRGRPLAVIEAKKNAINPYAAKQQALPYAKALGAPFVFLTNGELIYFWDYVNADARSIAGFFSRRGP